MSTPQIAVRPEALERTAARLAGASDRLGAVSRSLRRSSSRAVGDEGLADALDEFSEHWEHGLGVLAEGADVVAAQLREAARAYRAVDEGIAAACGG